MMYWVEQSYREKIEHSAYVEGGKNYNAPVQKVGDFLKSQKTLELGDIKPSYRPTVTPSDFKNIFPDFMYKALQEGIKVFDKQIKDFAQDNAVMTAVESRSSSPVRIVRKEDYKFCIHKGVISLWRRLWLCRRNNVCCYRWFKMWRGCFKGRIA